jgi:ParB/RepB/Spo0J family partition protein
LRRDDEAKPPVKTGNAPQPHGVSPPILCKVPLVFLPRHHEAEMTAVQLIPCKKIRTPKQGRRLAEATLNFLNDSIKMEGMYNPIVVRPDPQKEGHYLIVQGRHRHHVVEKMLKQEVIECRVFEEMDDEVAELASLSENVCRNALQKKERLLLIQRWQELYAQKYPDLIGRRASARAGAAKRWGQAKAAEAGEATGDAAGSEVSGHEAEASGHGAEASRGDVGDQADVSSADAHDRESTSREQTFNERVQAATGRSEKSVQRDVRITKGFKEDQLRSMIEAGLGDLDMIRILKATKGDPVERAEIVNLVCNEGMGVAEAIKEITGLDSVKDDSGRSKTAGTAATSATAYPVAAMSDEDWFASSCARRARYLGNTEQYKADAILYHRINEQRTIFRKQVKKILDAYREEYRDRKVGRFFFTVNKLLNVSHPSDWFLCNACRGQGRDESGGECKKCRGACYDIRTEKYL